MIIDNGLILVFIVILFFISYVIVFTLGLFIGGLYFNRGVSNDRISINRTNKNIAEKNTMNAISIDDSKFVTDIKTDGMEKKYESIAETKSSSEDISNSISKLKNMKR